MYQISIDKEAINDMPVVTYPGQIHVIDSVSRVRDAVEALRTMPIVGFDTETKPAFRRGEHHKVALLQLGAADHCFLFRLRHTGMPEPLLDYINDPACVKVGLSTGDDFNNLRRAYRHIYPHGFVELQRMAGDYLIADLSLQKMYAILFGCKISKSQRLTNWEAPTLTEAQQQYAAIDAWTCVRIYEYLRSGAFVPARSPYYHEVAPAQP